MKSYLLTSILVFLLAVSATAQNSDREIYPQQESIDHNNAVKNFSSDYITVFLSPSWLNLQNLNTGNTAFIDVDGSENITLLSQSGYGLTGIIDVDGSGNKMNMEQSGFNLLSILDIEGNANRFDMSQTGTGLQNYFKVAGSGANMEVQQTNAGMNYHQSGAGTIPLSIQQRGSATPIIIRNH